MKLIFLRKDTIKLIFCIIFWISIISSIGAPFITFENNTIKYVEARSIAPFFFLLTALIFF